MNALFSNVLLVGPPGYETCDVDTENNTVRVFSLSGINTVAILKYVKKHMDKNASEQKWGCQISADGWCQEIFRSILQFCISIVQSCIVV